jgi:hypothetical protein
VQGNYKYVVVTVEYFTKWIEAESLLNIAAAGLKRFFWQNIVCHFGVPRKITFDNAKQLNCHIFNDFYHQMGVEAAFASIVIPDFYVRIEYSSHMSPGTFIPHIRTKSVHR